MMAVWAGYVLEIKTELTSLTSVPLSHNAEKFGIFRSSSRSSLETASKEIISSLFFIPIALDFSGLILLYFMIIM